jgi:hypothetical protein
MAKLERKFTEEEICELTCEGCIYDENEKELFTVVHEEVVSRDREKNSNDVEYVIEDHSTGKFTLPKFIQPNKLIVFEGLHSFYLSNQAEVYDLKVFMEPDDQLRMWWKVQRDVAKRGYSPEKVLEQLKMREQDSEKYIKTQASQADIIAKFYPLNDIDPVNQTIEPIIALKITLSNEIYPDPLLEQLKSVVSLSMDHVYANDNQELIFKGTISKEQIELIADKCIPELEDIGIYNTDWKDNFEGMLQLVTTFVIFNRLKNKELNA